MLTAETTYNVIQALPSDELDRLFKMLGVSKVNIEKPKAKTKSEKYMLYDIDVREDLMKKLNRIREKNIRRFKNATVPTRALN